MLRNILLLVAAAALFVAGFFISKSMFEKKQQEVNHASATVLLEKVKKVMKLVTVEGNFSEIYDDTNIKQYTLYLPLPSKFQFPKTATVHVTGKVLVGYDMDGINITLDSTHQTVILDNVPIEAQILAIDHELSYKNLRETFFNSFKPSDFTKINKNAKLFLRKKAEESRLLDEAKQQGNQVLEAVRVMVEAAGWKLAITPTVQKAEPLLQ